MVISADAKNAFNNMNPAAQKYSLGDSIQTSGVISAPNDVYFVDPTNGTDDATSGHGKSWDTAFKTINYALGKMSAWDWLFLAGGDYDEGAVIPITLQGIKIIGPGNQNQHVAMIYSSSASHHLMTVNAHNVEICGVGFTQTKDTYNGIMISTTASYHKCHIHHCRFDGYGQGEYGVHGGTTYDCPDLIIENCRFHSWQTAGCYFYDTRGIFRNNIMLTVASKISLHLPATGGNRAGMFVTDNDILGVNSSDTGISVAAINAGSTFISGNRVCGHGTANISQFANGQYSGTLNYASSDAGGALIDIDS